MAEDASTNHGITDHREYRKRCILLILLMVASTYVVAEAVIAVSYDVGI